MADGMTANTALQRKTRPASSAAPPVTSERLWRRAAQHGLSRAAVMPVAVTNVAFDTVAPDTLLSACTDGALIALLEGPSGFALALIDAPVLAALVEVQTMGRVLRRAIAPREPTTIDAAMAADPLDRMLTAHDTLVDEVGGRLDTAGMVTGGGFRYATRLAAASQIAMSLADVPHSTVTLTLDLGEGARTGRIVLAFPRPAPAPAATAEDGWGARIEARLMQTEVPLRATLGHLRLTAEEVTALAVGDVLALPRAALDDIRMTTTGGQTLTTGRLGRSGTSKAVRLNPTPPAGGPAFDPAALPGRG